jgi:ribosomal protein L22
MSAEDEMDRESDADAPAEEAAATKAEASEQTPSAEQKPAGEQPVAAEEPAGAKAKPAAKASATKKPAARKKADAKAADAKAADAKAADAKAAGAKATGAKAADGKAAEKPAASDKPAPQRGSAGGKAAAESGRKRVPRLGKAKKPAAPSRRVVRAHARYVRTSARKARMVCGHLRGKSVQEARAILAFTPRDVARDWSKLLESAVANAESNHELLEDDLIIREAYADEGPTIKRFRPRAMGRATPIRKRTSHLTIALTPGSRTQNTKRQG